MKARNEPPQRSLIAELSGSIPWLQLTATQSSSVVLTCYPFRAYSANSGGERGSAKTLFCSVRAQRRGLPVGASVPVEVRLRGINGRPRMRGSGQGLFPALVPVTQEIADVNQVLKRQGVLADLAEYGLQRPLDHLFPVRIAGMLHVSTLTVQVNPRWHFTGLENRNTKP